jgi:cytochrome c oxidase subunit I
MSEGSTVNERPESGSAEGRRRMQPSWLTTTDHKRIGVLYIGTALCFFVVAIGLAMLMRTQLIRPGNTLLQGKAYNEVFTMHGTTMVFLFAMPMLAGLANYLIPLMIGARDMAFPRLNALSYWVFLFGGLLLYSSFFLGGAIDTGWFSYAPLTERLYSAYNGVDFWILAIALLGVSSVLGALNLIVTMRRLRTPGMRLRDMPVFAFANYVNSFLILFAMPSLTAAVLFLYLDRHYGTTFYDATRDGDPILWQHLFWFFGHPEVYILILPAFGIMSEVVPVFSRKPLFGRSTMLVMIMLIAFVGFSVWAHHMFTVGFPTMFNALFAAASMFIAVPTGVKIFNWLATMWGGALRFRTPLLFACGFIALFTIGGLTGVTLAMVPFDWQMEDSYYIVGHLHNVLFGGTLFGVFAGIYYWFPKVTGRRLSERLGKANFWFMLVGFVVTFLPMYILGLLGMPRRVYTYAPDLGWNWLNLISTLGGYTIAIGVTLFLINVVRSVRNGEPAGDDPWDAWTLEWATTSPPPPENFGALPPVTSERPLHDFKLAGWQREAAAVLDAAGAAGTRGTDGGASVIPADPGSPYPITVALAMLALAAGALASRMILVFAGVFLVGALAAWGWQTWGAASESRADHEGEPAPRTAVGLGMLFFLASETVFFGALIASYAHLRVRLGVWPPPGVPPLETGLAAINTLILLTSGVTAHWAGLNLAAGRVRRFTTITVLTVLLGAAFLGIQAWEYTHAGFGLSAGLMGSTFFTLTGIHGVHVAAGIVALLVALALTRSGRMGPDRMGLPQAAIYYWHFVDAVWVVLFIALYLL